MSSPKSLPSHHDGSHVIMAPKPKSSPPLAFLPSSNDALLPPAHLSPLKGGGSSSYFSPHGQQGQQYDVSSPMEQDLESQVVKQAEALRLQHQAFAVERECWELERDRLYKRIASLEGLLRSPKGPSPARSPIISPFVNSAPPAVPPTRVFSASNPPRLPSIAESFSPPLEQHSVSFVPQDISALGINGGVAHSLRNGHMRVDSLDYEEDLPISRQVLSPPPLEYRKHAGHTPIRVASRPSSSQGQIEETPTRRNTQKNSSLNRETDDDMALNGPLRLPALPSQPSEENFTVEALTLRLQYIEEHPDENEPLALSARSNRDDAAERQLSDAALKLVTSDTNGTQKESPTGSLGNTSAAGVASPPASVVSQTMSPQEFHERGGITLKKKTSTNFGAPFGQLKP